MLTAEFPHLHPSRLEPDLSARLHALAEDIDRIREGAGPSGDELAAAPLLTEWRWVVTVLGIRLIGTVVSRRHPRTRDVMTSPIWAADPHGGRWVRTTSRYYRLGPSSPLDGAPGARRNSGDFEGGL
jgi:hypothetical protein